VPPDAFGRFRVLHQIGAGTLGPVFRAHDPGADRPVAVKLFTVDMLPARAQQFVVELHRLVSAELMHPAVAAPIAAGLHGASPYLVQEFVAADSRDLVIGEYGAAPVNDALRVAAQLAGALDYANAVQIRHGALHPRDILLSSDETRLTGLGIAQALERIGIGARLRRPYTPPERIAAGEWDRRSDVFSLAALTHELLWARRIGGAGARAVEGLTPIPGADVGKLRAIFSRALAEDPAERFETALEFADALRLAFPDTVVSPPSTVAGRHASAIDQISDDVPEGATMFPQALPASATPEESRRPAAAPEDEWGVDLQLPLLDRAAEVDLPIAEIARAENDRYRDVEAAPAIVPRGADRPAGARSNTPAGLYLDYVRDEATPRATPDLPIAPPVGAVRPPAPEPIVTHEPRRSTRVPVLLALAIGAILGFGAGYGVGLRQRVESAAAPSSADSTTPAAGREFTETAVPEAPKPAPTPAEVPPPANANARAAAAPPRAATSSPPPASPSASPPVAPAGGEGRVLVRTTPSGARVFVDGKEYGVTPFAVRNLAQGGHTVRVVRDGYTSEERRVELTASQPSQSLTIALDRAAAIASRGSQAPAPAETESSERFTGDLYVASRPPGATVFMDGKQVGTTPLSLRGVAIGSHAIRLEAAGYRRWSSAVRVVADQANRVTASLER
jgi:serine/threonine protein kinase